MTNSTELPDAFDSLAAICKFIAVSRISPEFYAQYQHPIDFTCAYIRQLATLYPPVEKAFRASLPLSISDGAKHIQQAIATTSISENDLSWFNNQMTEVLKILLPVVRDSNLPEWLSEMV
jgi:hypothetical protein